jgi:class 3 adenylate cyclase
MALYESKTLWEEVLRLRRSVNELSVLNEVATALGRAADLKKALKVLIGKSRHATGAAEGAIVLVDESEGDDAPTLVRTAATKAEYDPIHLPPAIIGWIQYHREPLRIADPAHDARFEGVRWPPGTRNVLAVPMMVKNRLVGVLAHYNAPAEGGFSEGDARLLDILAGQSAQVVERMRIEEERRQAEAARAEVMRLFGQHTAPSVVEALVAWGGEVPVRRQDVTVLFLDLRGFTKWAEDRAPEEVVAYLNAFFDLATGIVNRHGGIVHQLLGDGFMAYFGVPEPDRAAPRRAVDAALEIVRGVEAACAGGTLPPTQLGIGIHAGEAVTGLVGSAVHREYKVTGDVVNTAARVEKLNKSCDACVLVTEAVWARLGPDAPPGEALGMIALEGRRQPIGVYRLA